MHSHRYPPGVPKLRRLCDDCERVPGDGHDLRALRDVVREEVSEISGVTDIQVSAQTGKLVVSASGEVDDAKVLAAVEEAGYAAVRV